MVLDIVKYGAAVLRETARPVPSVTPALVQLAEDMVDTMHKARGGDGRNRARRLAENRRAVFDDVKNHNLDSR